MASIKELRLRIRALKNISKITSAMKMISAARLRKAQDALVRTRPYAEKAAELLDRISGSIEDVDDALLQVREAKRVRYYVITSDRGLCGGFNNNVFRFLARNLDAADQTEGVGVGRRAREFLVRRRIKTLTAEHVPNTPAFANAARIANEAMRDYREGKVDRVYLVYNRFVSTLSQVPVKVQLLPFTAPEKGKPPAGAAGAGAHGYRKSYIIEPGPAELFGELLPKLVTVQVFRSLIENAIGEHSARMTAMDNATKNTKDLISSYTLQANRARQAAITKELIEIVSGAEALK